MGFLSLKDYGIIGNQVSAALVSRMGSVDWCCLPYFDSSSHFAALLDDNQGGSFQICPKGSFESDQKYIEKTNVLETYFETPLGLGLITDWMPIEDQFNREPAIVRNVKTLSGTIDWVLNCTPRFRYGADRAQAERRRGGILFRGPTPGDIAYLSGTLPIKISEDARCGHLEFEIPEGRSAQFTWVFGREKPRDTSTPEATTTFWKNLAHSCKPGKVCLFAGPWHDSVVRSHLTSKLLTSHFSGAVSESATTSLPSLKGSSRNWDFRYMWIHDSAFAYQALHQLDQTDEAEDLFTWVSDIVIRDGADGLQPVYTLDGGKYLPEQDLTFLSGYAGARPVRVGNTSARHFQLDTYGHVFLMAVQRFQTHKSLPVGLWEKLSEIADYIAQAWRRPDRGPWEVRSKPEHFVASKVLCWVALDRACWLAEAMDLPSQKRWKDEAATLHRTICEQGFDSISRTFVRSFGERNLDASALLIPLVGFLPPDDVRIQGTLDAIQSKLSEGVLVHRYRGQDGLPEADGAHLIESCWFISCLALSGRTGEASDRLAELCTYATPLGLFGEQSDPTSGDPSGNFPSASAHFALINSGIYVGAALGRSLTFENLIGSQQIFKARQSHAA